MINFIKGKKALTLVEVLVAVILTAIVMLHGTTFFMATWRLSAESKEYSMILNDVTANLENYIARPYNNNVVIQDSEYKVKSKQLRGQYDVTYTIVKDTTNFVSCGSYYVISSAKWRYGGDEKSNNRISIKTVCAKEWNKQG